MKCVLSRYVALGIAAFLGTDVLALDYSPSATAVPVPSSGAKIDFLGDTFEEDGWNFIQPSKSSRGRWTGTWAAGLF